MNGCQFWYPVVSEAIVSQTAIIGRNEWEKGARGSSGSVSRCLAVV